MLFPLAKLDMLLASVSKIETPPCPLLESGHEKRMKQGVLRLKFQSYNLPGKSQ